MHASRQGTRTVVAKPETKPARLEGQRVCIERAPAAWRGRRDHRVARPSTSRTEPEKVKVICPAGVSVAEGFGSASSCG